jgi:hypothetical protein
VIAIFGGPANSESPVALRPPFARGLPFRLLSILDCDRFTRPSQSVLSDWPRYNRFATRTQGESREPGRLNLGLRREGGRGLADPRRRTATVSPAAGTVPAATVRDSPTRVVPLLGLGGRLIDIHLRRWSLKNAACRQPPRAGTDELPGALTTANRRKRVWNGSLRRERE